MSCAILNTMKLCINQAQTDILREEALSYIDGAVNLEGRGGGVQLRFKFYEKFHEAHICYVHNLPS